MLKADDEQENSFYPKISSEIIIYDNNKSIKLYKRKQA